MGILIYQGKEYKNIDFADIYHDRAVLYKNKNFVNSTRLEKDSYAVVCSKKTTNKGIL